MADTKLHPELVNLAETLDDGLLKEVGAEVCKIAERDEQSRKSWDAMHARWIDLYFQQDRPMNPPWEGSSTESMPLLAEACNQFHARAFKAFFPNRNIFKAVPIGEVDRAAMERSDRVSKHLTWQLLDRDPAKKYKRDKDRLLLAAPLHGSVFTKTYYDPVRREVMVRNVRATDLLIPYGTGPRDIESLPHKTEIIWKTVNDTKILAEKGYFVEAAEPWKGIKTRAKEADDASERAEGIERSGYAEDEIYALLYEHHGLFDLDDDGIAEPYIVTVDAQSEKVLRISIRYETDDLGNPLFDREPTEFYTHYTFLENPDGFNGLGMGHLIGHINTAVNKMLRQTVDAGTLANSGNSSGFISRALSTKKGEISFQLGKFMVLENQADEIQKGVYQFKFPGPSAVLPEMMAALIARSDRLATVTEAISGQLDQYQQPTTVLALIDQGLEVFSTVYERLFTAWESELNKIARLNARFMDEKEYFAILKGDNSLEGQGFAGKNDYAMGDLQIALRIDPKMTNEKQRITRAQAEFQFATSNPFTMQSPQHLFNACRRYAEALNLNHIEEILPNPAEMMAQQLPRQDDPMQENIMALMPQGVVPQAFPDQDHIVHLRAHEGLLTDVEYSARLTPAGKQALTMHVQQHIAMMYAATEAGGMAPPPIPGAEGGAGGIGAMAGAAGNPMGAGPVAGMVQNGNGVAPSDLVGAVEPAQGPKGRVGPPV